MHHKRKRPKSRRSGCLLCKPHKGNGCAHGGRMDGLNMKNLKRMAFAAQEMKYAP